jgi:tetratricopeptide (TPR) repeat protein
LDHRDPKIRVQALQALTSIASPELFKSVFEKALGLPDGSKEQLLLQYLSKVGGKAPKVEHIRALTRLLELELPRAALDQALELAANFPPPNRKTKAELDQALERWLSHPGAKVLAARAMARHGNKSGVKKVLSELGRFIRKNRRVPYGYIQRARAYLAFGRYAEALKDAKEALRFSRNKADPALFLLAAEIEMRRGKPLGILRYLKEGDLSKEMLQQFRRDHPELETILKNNSRLRRFFRSQ